MASLHQHLQHDAVFWCGTCEVNGLPEFAHAMWPMDIAGTRRSRTSSAPLPCSWSWWHLPDSPDKSYILHHAEDQWRGHCVPSIIQPNGDEHPTEWSCLDHWNSTLL